MQGWAGYSEESCDSRIKGGCLRSEKPRSRNYEGAHGDEVLLMSIIAENVHLRGQVDALKGDCGESFVPRSVAGAPAPPAPVMETIAPMMPKPVDPGR